MKTGEHHQVIVVGAGVGGLSCARALKSRGADVIVMERARGVGGRCATRRIEGQPVDHGVMFLHGSEPMFIDALKEVTVDSAKAWPIMVQGEGKPCQPRAFNPGEVRFSFEQGVNSFAKHLAQGVDVRLGCNVIDVQPDERGTRIRLESGQALTAKHLVLALAHSQTLHLLAGWPATHACKSAFSLLEMISAQACLTTIALYPRSTRAPEWDIFYPEDSAMLQLISHDSSKRRAPKWLALVMQARPAWSRAHLSTDVQQWSRLMFEEAARLAGEWIKRPQVVDTQSWRYARIDSDSELKRPLVLDTPSGGSIAFTGELFAPSGGVQAAYLAGRQLAERLAERLTERPME